jgi:hypothetical protein
MNLTLFRGTQALCKATNKRNYSYIYIKLPELVETGYKSTRKSVTIPDLVPYSGGVRCQNITRFTTINLLNRSRTWRYHVPACLRGTHSWSTLIIRTILNAAYPFPTLLHHWQKLNVMLGSRKICGKDCLVAPLFKFNKAIRKLLWY